MNRNKKIQDMRDDYIEHAIKIKKLQDECTPWFETIKEHEVALNGERSFTIKSRSGSYMPVIKEASRIGWIPKTGRKAFIKKILNDAKVLAWFDDQQKESKGPFKKKAIFNIED